MMDNFISIVFDDKPDSNFSRTFLACFENVNESLLESETEYLVFEAKGGKTVYRIGISESPNDAEADKLADHLYTHLYTQGYDNFDIEITADDLAEDANQNLDIVKSLVDPAAQQRMAQTQLAKRDGAKERRLNDLKNLKLFDDPLSMIKTALNMGATPEEVIAAMPDDIDLTTAPTKDQIAQQRANDPFLQSGPDVREETYDGDDFYEAYGDLWFNEDEVIDEAEYQGRKVKLGKPMRGDVKKFKVYVKNPKGNVVKVNFGDPDMKIKKSNPARRRSFRARHNCDNPGPRHKARYWSCRKW